MGQEGVLRTQEYRRLLHAIDRLSHLGAPSAFPALLFDIISELLPGTVASFDFVERKSGKVESHIMSEAIATAPIADLEAAVRQFAWQNPVVSHLTNVSPTTVVQPTDFISQREFRRTDFYQLAFRPLGIEYQIASGLARAGHAGGFIVNRPGHRNFTKREVELVRRFRPHVERAFINTLLVANLRPRLEATSEAAPENPGIALAAEGLTAREIEVLHWIAEGKRNGEIAVILGISARTVHKHVEHILAKLGVETRTAAIAAVGSFFGASAVGRKRHQ